MSNPIYKKNRHLPWQSISDETIIINPEQQFSFELNSVGSFIWQKIDGELDSDQILSMICEEFDVTTEEAKQDLDQMLEVMEENQLILIEAQ